MPTKIEDVAQRAGVSTATVSRVLSGKPYVSEDLKVRVLTAAQELDYRPSRVARSLREQRSRIIGLIISDIQNPFFTSIVRAVEDGAHASGHAVFLCNTDEDEAKETLYIDLMLAEHVAGVILSSTTGRNPAYNHLIHAGIPAVAIDRRVYNVPLDTVLVDNIGATRRAVEHLIAQGHRRIGAIVGHLSSSTGEERLRGYTDALMAHKIPVSDALIRIGTPRAPVGYLAMSELLALPAPPDRGLHGQQPADGRRLARALRRRAARAGRFCRGRLRRHGMGDLHSARADDGGAANLRDRAHRGRAAPATHRRPTPPAAGDHPPCAGHRPPRTAPRCRAYRSLMWRAGHGSA
jgi:DNA-binding LacI/PurR family transcriptional regulator